MTEDWDRVYDLDRAYLYEMERQMQEEHWQWCDEHEKELERLPAKITVFKPQENEADVNTLSF